MSESNLQLASQMRGLYKRVADKLGVDAYVSRVARGERRSPKIGSLDRETSKLLTSVSADKGQGKEEARQVGAESQSPITRLHGTWLSFGVTNSGRNFFWHGLTFDRVAFFAAISTIALVPKSRMLRDIGNR